MARVKLGDVAKEFKSTIKDSTGFPVVGLEHLIPCEIALSNWDEDVETTFTKGFKKGHVLFGRRRAYLKKAAVAPFDGICSGDIIVIEAIEDKIRPGLLPYIIQNDLLFDFAMSRSAGGLSPRVKWADLKEYEFNLPPLLEQDRLIDILSASYETKQAYQKLIAQTDELVKSQFIEMFGDIKEHIKLPLVEFGSLIEIGPQNGLYKSSKFYRLDQSSTPIVRVDSFYDGRVTDYSTLKRLDCSSEEISTYGLKDGDLVFNRVNGSVEHVGKCALISGLREETVFESNMMRVRTDPSKVDIGFLSTYLCSDIVRNQIKEKARVANQASVNQRDIRSILIPLPDIELQREYATFVRQSDKSKFVCSNRNLSRCLVIQYLTPSIYRLRNYLSLQV